MHDMGYQIMEKRQKLSKIRQCSDKPHQVFVSCLLQAVSCLMVDGESKILIVKQLAHENYVRLMQHARLPCIPFK